MVTGYWYDWKKACRRLDIATTIVNVIMVFITTVSIPIVASIPWDSVKVWAYANVREGMVEFFMQLIAVLVPLVLISMIAAVYWLLRSTWLSELSDERTAAHDVYLYAAALTGAPIED